MRAGPPSGALALDKNRRLAAALQAQVHDQSETRQQAGCGRRRPPLRSRAAAEFESGAEGETEDVLMDNKRNITVAGS